MKTLFNLMIFLSLFGLGCTKQNADLIPIDVPSANAERILRFYMGGEADAFKSGLVVLENGKYFLSKSKASTAFPTLAQKSEIRFKDIKEEAFLNYYERRNIPPKISDLKFDKAAAFVTEVQGSMTQLRRKIYVPTVALEKAIADYTVHQKQILYPVGTVIYAEHFDGAALKEYSVMQKRQDEQWDFMVYDANGNLKKETLAHPIALKVPGQCTGCHFGKKLFEPEASFPNPKGTKQIFGTFSEAQKKKVAQFEEHQKRSDGILGIYAGLYGK